MAAFSAPFASLMLLLLISTLSAHFTCSLSWDCVGTTVLLHPTGSARGRNNSPPPQYCNSRSGVRRHTAASASFRGGDDRVVPSPPPPGRTPARGTNLLANLLTDPAVLLRTVLVAALLLLLDWSPVAVPRAPLPGRAGEILRHFLLPLFGGGCCALQMVFNALNLGCAGLNGVVGPYRPLPLGWAAYAVIRQRGRGASLPIFAASLLPEWVALFSWMRQRRGGLAAGEGMAAVTVVAVDGMGCSACVAKVSGAAREALVRIGVDGAVEVDLDGGRVSIISTGGDEASTHDVGKAVAEAVRAGGFETRVL